MTKQLTVRLSDETYEALVRLAEHEDRAPAVVVRMAVMRHLALSAQPLSAEALARAQVVGNGESVVPVTDYGNVTLSTPAPKPAASTPSATHLPCGHSKVLLRGGLCRGCNPMVPG